MASKTFLKIVFFSFVLQSCFPLYPSVSFDDLFKPEFRVVIKNLLPANSPALRIHCKSGDDDIGYKVTHANGEYIIHFHENVWSSTLYFCHFWWGQKQQVFEIFSHNTKCPRANDGVHKGYICPWHVRSDGFHFGSRFGWTKPQNWK